MSAFDEQAPFNMLHMPTQIPDMKPQGGMFGGGKFGWKQAIAFGLAGFMARRNPALMQGLMAMMQQKQDRQDAEADYQRRRGDQQQDWLARQQWGLDHPEARAPHYFESNSGDQYTIGADGKPVEVFHDPFRYKLVPNGMGGVVPVDIGSLMGGQAQKPVGKLTPIDEGGPMPSASGGFPRY